MQEPSMRRRHVAEIELSPANVRRLRDAGTMLAAKRKAKGMKVEQISAAIGLAPSKVLLMETYPQHPSPGRKLPNPNMKKMMLYCQVLELDWAVLWPPDPDSPEAQLHRYLADKPPGAAASLLTLFGLFDERRVTSPSRKCALPA